MSRAQGRRRPPAVSGFARSFSGLSGHSYVVRGFSAPPDRFRRCPPRTRALPHTAASSPVLDIPRRNSGRARVAPRTYPRRAAACVPPNIPIAPRSRRNARCPATTRPFLHPPPQPAAEYPGSPGPFPARSGAPRPIPHRNRQTELPVPGGARRPSCSATAMRTLSPLFSDSVPAPPASRSPGARAGTALVPQAPCAEDGRSACPAPIVHRSCTADGIPEDNPFIARHIFIVFQ